MGMIARRAGYFNLFDEGVVMDLVVGDIEYLGEGHSRFSVSDHATGEVIGYCTFDPYSLTYGWLCDEAVLALQPKVQVSKNHNDSHEMQYNLKRVFIRNGHRVAMGRQRRARSSR